MCPRFFKAPAKQSRKSTRKLQTVIDFTHLQIPCDQLVSTCVGWTNGEKRASTCVRIWARPKSTQVGGQTKSKLNASRKPALTLRGIWPERVPYQWRWSRIPFQEVTSAGAENAVLLSRRTHDHQEKERPPTFKRNGWVSQRIKPFSVQLPRVDIKAAQQGQKSKEKRQERIKISHHLTIDDLPAIREKVSFNSA